MQQHDRPPIFLQLVVSVRMSCGLSDGESELQTRAPRPTFLLLPLKLR